mgnify:CR=1 FL=1
MGSNGKETVATGSQIGFYGPKHEPDWRTALDAIFYLWAFALFLEEMHQWAVDASREYM